MAILDSDNIIRYKLALTETNFTEKLLKLEVSIHQQRSTKYGQDTVCAMSIVSLMILNEVSYNIMEISKMRGSLLSSSFMDQ